MKKRIDVSALIVADPDILGGTPVFKGTRVPVQSLFWHLEKRVSIEEFLDDFPSVSHEQIVGVLEISANLFDVKKYNILHEIAA